MDFISNEIIQAGFAGVCVLVLWILYYVLKTTKEERCADRKQRDRIVETIDKGYNKLARSIDRSTKTSNKMLETMISNESGSKK